MRNARNFGRVDDRGATNRGFTLVELMIVVIIVGVLAAIVMAFFGTPLAQAKETALSGGLRNFRTQLMTYRLQHNDNWPDATLVSQQMLGQTDVAGNVGTGAAYPLGPYLQSFPQNPYNGRSDVKSVPAGSPLTPDDTTGWLYQVDGGRFSIAANSTQADSIGKLLVDY